MFCITDQSNRGRFNSPEGLERIRTMRIKHNARIAITAEQLGVKSSRLQAIARAEQAERLLREDGLAERPSTRKPKRGKQGLPGRTRVERARRPEAISAKRILELQEMLAEMAIAEVLKDEKGQWYRSPTYVGLRWTHPACFVCEIRGSSYKYAQCWYELTIEGLMAFEGELFYRRVLPREYVTPDEIVRVTGRQLGK
jgi:hypothetical protein